jgi:putative nucleotidyltransferase with HDIG domain
VVVCALVGYYLQNEDSEFRFDYLDKRLRHFLLVSSSSGGGNVRRRILFVDDQPELLNGLGGMLSELGADWDLRLTTSGTEGLALLDREQVDVVVCGMLSQEMNDLQFLTEVRNRHPHVIRMILSARSDEKPVMRSVGMAHQFLPKPCSPEIMISTIARALDLRQLLTDEKLKVLVSQMKSLPSLPELYGEMMKELQSPDASIARIAEIISQDPGMTAKIFQLVNSPFFGIRRRITEMAAAIAFLGLDTVQWLALSVQAFAQFETSKVPDFSVEQVWRHSLTVAAIARGIACMEFDKTMADDAFCAGLLHDIGMVILASNLPEQYAEVIAQQKAKGAFRSEVENEFLGSTHAEVGAYLLGLWGLPDAIVQAVALHHRPRDGHEKKVGLLCLIHVADALAYGFHPPHSVFRGAPLDEQYVIDTGVSAKLAAWRDQGFDFTQEYA